jgi:HSP20 family protein
MKLTRQKQQEERGTLASTGRGGLSPFADLNRIRNEIDWLFEDPFAPMPSTSFFEGWQPSLDVYEDKDRITIKAELPGMKLEDIDVSVHGNTLAISGERKHEEEHKERENYRAERYFGRFQRSVTLPAAVDAEKVRATYKHGILTIECPKSEEAKPKQIEVKTS